MVFKGEMEEELKINSNKVRHYLGASARER
jgi:hypothetical protein